MAGPSSAGTVTLASSLLTEVYNPKAVVPHAALLHQACAHCAIFPTAASRRSLGRVSVPVWPVALSGRLPVVALVGHHPTNKLIGREPIPDRKTFHPPPCRGRSYPVLAPVSEGYPKVQGRLLTCYSPVRRSSTPERAFPLDLHVLSTPPAFVLSQDQTLQKNWFQHPPKEALRVSISDRKNNQTDCPSIQRNPTPTKMEDRVQKLALNIVHAVEFSRIGRASTSPVTGWI